MAFRTNKCNEPNPNLQSALALEQELQTNHGSYLTRQQSIPTLRGRLEIGLAVLLRPVPGHQPRGNLHAALDSVPADSDGLAGGLR